MNDMHFIYLNLIIVILLVLFFLKGKSHQAPSKLKLNKKHARHQHKDITDSRSLTICFNYKGEIKEAYEVLGLPAGAPLEMAETAYQKILAGQTQTDNLHLNAIQAIRKKHSSQTKTSH